LAAFYFAPFRQGRNGRFLFLLSLKIPVIQQDDQTGNNYGDGDENYQGYAHFIPPTTD
jgi:hypothetical protein